MQLLSSSDLRVAVRYYTTTYAKVRRERAVCFLQHTKVRSHATETVQRSLVAKLRRLIRLRRREQRYSATRPVRTKLVKLVRANVPPQTADYYANYLRFSCINYFYLFPT